MPAAFFHQQYGQWLFLVPLIGGRYHITRQLAVYTTYIPLIVLANWVITCYLPPIEGEPGNSIEYGNGPLEPWRLRAANLVIFGGPREMFSSDEFTAIKERGGNDVR